MENDVLEQIIAEELQGIQDMLREDERIIIEMDEIKLMHKGLIVRETREAIAEYLGRGEYEQHQ